jgi:hypothetical protein
MNTPLPAHPDYPNEAAITHSNGAQIRFEAYPESVSYVRVLDATGEEIAYWTIDELQEDPSDVMGAIFGACIGGKKL